MTLQESSDTQRVVTRREQWHAESSRTRREQSHMQRAVTYLSCLLRIRASWQRSSTAAVHGWSLRWPAQSCRRSPGTTPARPAGSPVSAPVSEGSTQKQPTISREWFTLEKHENIKLGLLWAIYFSVWYGSIPKCGDHSVMKLLYTFHCVLPFQCWYILPVHVCQT